MNGYMIVATIDTPITDVYDVKFKVYGTPKLGRMFRNIESARKEAARMKAEHDECTCPNTITFTVCPVKAWDVEGKGGYVGK